MSPCGFDSKASVMIKSEFNSHRGLSAFKKNNKKKSGPKEVHSIF